MIYLQDEGVTVTDSALDNDGSGEAVFIQAGRGESALISHTEADAVLVGLLRWKLERVWKSWRQMLNWASKEYDVWWKERRR